MNIGALPSNTTMRLLGQVDLGVLAGVGTPGVDADRVLHRPPHPRRDVARHRLPLHPEHELLVRPHGGLGQCTELAVDRAGIELEVGETALQPRDVLAERAGGEGAAEHRSGWWWSSPVRSSTALNWLPPASMLSCPTRRLSVAHPGDHAGDHDRPDQGGRRDDRSRTGRAAIRSGMGGFTMGSGFAETLPPSYPRPRGSRAGLPDR